MPRPARLALLALLLAPTLTPTLAAATSAAQEADRAPAALSPQAGVGDYLAIALAESPEVQAAHARWEVAVHRVARSRSLPEPTLSFGVFLSAVETRVGPQQARVSVQQAFPWPTALIAGGDAASAEARAAQARFEGAARGVALGVEHAYWTLWELRRAMATHEAHLSTLQSLQEALRGRVEVGSAALSDLQQVGLTVARLIDRIDSLRAEEAAAAARLLARVGRPELSEAPTAQGPEAPQLPVQSQEALLALALGHPVLEGVSARAEAAEHRVRVAQAQRLPGLTVGGDWILVGPSEMEVDGSGRDALALGVGVKVPLWQRRYSEDISAARAEGEALRADLSAEEHAVQAALVAAVVAVEDSARRAKLYEDALLPQAEGLYSSLIGSYAAGRAGVAQLLLAQGELLELSAGLDQARAAHARAWATLEQLCGPELRRRPVMEAE